MRRLQGKHIVNEAQHLLIGLRRRVVCVDAMSRVRRNVHGEVTGLRVQVLHILRNVCAVAACGYGVAVSVAEWEILSAGDLCQY